MHNALTDVVILGAPRSGTNMLRDCLVDLPGVTTWPCDEINYIWRHGNVRYPSDELPVEAATPKVARYIRAAFDRRRNRDNAPVVVEKTCANTLRVGFVDRVLPNAKYVVIVRDGVDALASAQQRWKAEMEPAYLAKKARFVPSGDLPFYATRFLWSRAYRSISKEGRLAYWGPSLSDMDDILATNDLNAVCAIQWQRCVDATDEALGGIDPDRVIRITYEEFVTSPRDHLAEVTKFLQVPASDVGLEKAVASVTSSSLGKGRKALGAEEVTRLSALVEPTLARYSYA